MALTPLTALIGAAAPAVARTTFDAAREVVAARPFAHLLAAGGDVLEAGGEAVQNAFSAQEPPAPAATDTADPLAELRREVQGATALLAARIEERLAQAGIDLSLPLEFAVHPGGKLELASPHPQKEAIEAVLAEDREIGQLATYVEATQKVLHTSDSHKALLADSADGILGSLERRAAEVARQPAETLHLQLKRGEMELEYR